WRQQDEGRNRQRCDNQLLSGHSVYISRRWHSQEPPRDYLDEGPPRLDRLLPINRPDHARSPVGRAVGEDEEVARLPHLDRRRDRTISKATFAGDEGATCSRTAAANGPRAGGCCSYGTTISQERQTFDEPEKNRGCVRHPAAPRTRSRVGAASG